MSVIENEKTPLATGVAVISGAVKTLPNTSGVYRMMGANGELLYVGKARNLKKRVASYTRVKGDALAIRTLRMIALTRSMEFTTTRSESAALLLEANLIKRLKPRFNVLLRDDKSFPYILITRDHPSPQLLKHRGPRKRKGDYFGPFAAANAVNHTIHAMQRAFLLRSCDDTVFSNRTRPCLLYQIKRCAGPCTGETSQEEYDQLVDQAKEFLSGRSQSIKESIVASMEKAAASLDYERAAIYRDRLSALSTIQMQQGVDPKNTESADVFAISQQGGVYCVQVFFYRNWQNWGNINYLPRADAQTGAQEVLSAFIPQFYARRPVPKTVLLSQEVEDPELMSEALQELAGSKVELIVPQRGEKKQMVDEAKRNAKMALERHFAQHASQKSLMGKLADLFRIDHPVRRIEVYDNSHIMGTNAVGAMIVATVDGFVKNQYRKYNFKSEDLVPGDDYGMMKEMLTRRFERLLAADRTLKETTQYAQNQIVPQSDDEGNSALQHIADNEAVPDMDWNRAQQVLDEAQKDEDMAEIESSIDRVAGAWPDLVIIDGGVGQLSVALQIFKELGIEQVSLIAVSKGPDRNAGREQFHVPNRQMFSLPERDPVLYFIQRLRDEAHRFAIGSHRVKRKKSISQTTLDDVPGVGQGRKKLLLQHFGSSAQVRRAGIDDLKSVKGISAQLAETIFAFFNEHDGTPS